MLKKKVLGEIVYAFHKGEDIRFFVTNRNDVIQSQHSNGNFYEMEELAIIASYFVKGSVFVDAGANVGNHTLFVSKFLGPSRVYCFEPNPPVAEQLRINVSLNGLNSVVDLSFLSFGLSSTFGVAVPWTGNPNNSGSTRLIAGAQEGEMVPVATGDNFFLNRKCDFIKVDVEGMELDVLTGFKGCLEKWRPLLFVEVSDLLRDQVSAFLTQEKYEIKDVFRRYSTNENWMCCPL
ncbi:MAG: FkbM family methyltransferase [Pseudorhodoplanes sp.]|uniref:FkbM family methyltransferase n=1 Tax=Pseudorhodoplanes sp. TaxID=1934341 RepID=UPI003D0CAAA3